MAAGVAAVLVDEDDGARWPRWEGGGVCCPQTGHRRQLQKINILLLLQTGAKVQEKINPYRATLTYWWPFILLTTVPKK